MRSARQPAEPEPVPEREDLDAEAAQALAEYRAAIAEIRDAFRSLPGAACDPRLPDRMQLAAAATYDSGAHLEEVRRKIVTYEEKKASEDVYFAAGRAYERDHQDAPQLPRQSHRRTSGSRASGGWQQAVLTAVKVLVPAAAVGAWAALKGSVKAHRLATVALTATLPAAALGGALYTITPGSPGGSYGSSTAPAPAASVYGAVPAPSESLIATITRPKVKHGTKGKELDAAGLPVTCCWVAPEPSSSSSQSSPQPSSSATAQGGHAVLTVSTTAIDLTAGPAATATITLSAAGNAGSWVAWLVDAKDPTTGTDQGDLDFSATSGVLLAGTSTTVTVSVDVAQAADGDASEVFTIDGQQVTANLPPLVPTVSVSPSVLPSDLPSVLPSPSSS